MGMFHESEKRNERVRVRVTGKIIMKIRELEMIRSPMLPERGKASHSQGSNPAVRLGVGTFKIIMKIRELEMIRV